MAEYSKTLWDDLRKLMLEHEGFENMKLSKDGRLEIVLLRNDASKKMIMHFLSLQEAEEWISDHLIGFDELDEDSIIQ